MKIFVALFSGCLLTCGFLSCSGGDGSGDEGETILVQPADPDVNPDQLEAFSAYLRFREYQCLQSLRYQDDALSAALVPVLDQLEEAIEAQGYTDMTGAYALLDEGGVQQRMVLDGPVQSEETWQDADGVEQPLEIINASLSVPAEDILLVRTEEQPGMFCLEGGVPAQGLLSEETEFEILPGEERSLDFPLRTLRRALRDGDAIAWASWNSYTSNHDGEVGMVVDGNQVLIYRRGPGNTFRPPPLAWATFATDINACLHELRHLDLGFPDESRCRAGGDGVQALSLANCRICSELVVQRRSYRRGNQIHVEESVAVHFSAQKVWEIDCLCVRAGQFPCTEGPTYTARFSMSILRNGNLFEHASDYSTR